MDTPAAAPAAPPRRRPALSPSRAGDFKQCPLLYRFRAIDRLPERPSRAQVRGTVVHAVLERLYDLPAAQRSPAAAAELVAPVWAELCEQEPELVGQLFEGVEDPALPVWLESMGPLLDAYFRLEDPRRLEPEARELLVETELESGLLLRGYVDRLDVAATGQMRVVDYRPARRRGRWPRRGRCSR
jgi:putative RecB family exonuclease